MPGLPTDATGRAITEARKEGVFAGLSSGLVSGEQLSQLKELGYILYTFLVVLAIIGSRLLGFKRNTTIFCGVLTGILSGYFFTQAFKDTAMAQLRAEEARLRSIPQNKKSPENLPCSTI